MIWWPRESWHETAYGLGDAMKPVIRKSKSLGLWSITYIDVGQLTVERFRTWQLAVNFLHWAYKNKWVVR